MTEQKPQPRMPEGKKFINKFETILKKYNIEKQTSGVEVRTPINGELLGCFTEHWSGDLEEKINTLTKAQKLWRNYPAPKRGELIRQFGNLVREAKEDLSTMITLENEK